MHIPISFSFEERQLGYHRAPAVGAAVGAAAGLCGSPSLRDSHVVVPFPKFSVEMMATPTSQVPDGGQNCQDTENRDQHLASAR